MTPSPSADSETCKCGHTWAQHDDGFCTNCKAADGGALICFYPPEDYDDE